eukprot:5212005-Ditylum_brightwellii.AAC.2
METITKNLLRIALAWCQYQVGTGTPVLANPQVHLPHIEARWIPSLCKYLNLIDSAIEVDNAYIPAVQRKNDDYIMDIIISPGNNFIGPYAGRWQTIRFSVLTGSNVSIE